jgi:hypothetical protein
MKNLFLILFLTSNIALFGQTKKVEKKAEQDTEQADPTDILDAELDEKDSIFLAKPYLQIGGSYVNKVAFNGRTEGINQYGISPSARVHFGKGWYLDYEGGFYSAENPQYSFSSVGAAKSFEFGAATLDVGFSRWFFNYAATTTDVSEYNGEIDANLMFTIGNFTFGSANAILTGKTRAVFLEPVLNWEMSGRFGANRLLKWTFSPSALVDIGNDVTTRVVKLRPNRPGRLVSKPIFAVLNYGLSLPISLGYKNTDATFTFHYIVPQNTDLPNTNTPITVLEFGLTQRFGF